jgi:hypothetical protein
MDIDVEVDLLDADLFFAVTTAFVPSALPHLCIFDLRKLETFPVTAGRQASATPTAKLEDESFFVAAFASDNDRATLAACGYSASDTGSGATSFYARRYGSTLPTRATGTLTTRASASERLFAADRYCGR